jgi:hypothetical protein
MKRVKKEKLKDKKIEKEFREGSKKTKRMRILTSLKKKGNPKGKENKIIQLRNLRNKLIL